MALETTERKPPVPVDSRQFWLGIASVGIAALGLTYTITDKITTSQVHQALADERIAALQVQVHDLDAKLTRVGEQQPTNIAKALIQAINDSDVKKR